MQSGMVIQHWSGLETELDNNGSGHLKGESSDVTVEAKRILPWNFYSHPVVLEALTWVEVEDKDHVSPVKHNDLVLSMLGADKGLEGEEGERRRRGGGERERNTIFPHE
ncbi:hypothetical protein EYF80_014688 [Liparis tanakae]|uniref:Uncharacterized protein n=1 Tax=Liparis tanakae TaxID=230148 RepID=A0A4Z2ICC4_9TELE|nr:hypothetical protein EYF80_014688 [Liparis tanakae]